MRAVHVLHCRDFCDAQIPHAQTIAQTGHVSNSRQHAQGNSQLQVCILLRCTGWNVEHKVSAVPSAGYFQLLSVDAPVQDRRLALGPYERAAIARSSSAREELAPALPWEEATTFVALAHLAASCDQTRPLT